MKALAASGDLHAFADDIKISVRQAAMINTVIEEFKKLEADFGFTINLKKTVIVPRKGDALLPQTFDNKYSIEITRKTKYLGMTISNDVAETIKECKKSIRRNLAAFKGKV